MVLHYSLFCMSIKDPIPEPLVEETPPDDDERKLTNENSFDANLPPELRKLMEQTKQ
ncbi:unnamed protein product, partial [Didymodactylos carnosus]